MINSITLTNFKQHENLTIAFGTGFTAIRGANESGKSTILLAIAYALFGTKAIPDSLDDTVTWGSPVGTLRVDLDFTIDGVPHKVRRSKASCQLDYADQTVTGQVEVTNFVARLLKVDAGAAARLTIANQSAIRGALEAGPKATTELIERLSEFDQIDKLIEIMQEKLTLGNTATATAAIAAAADDLARAKELAVPVDSVAAQARIDAAGFEFADAMAELDGAEKTQAAAQETHSQLREKAVTRDNLVRDVTRAQTAQRAAQQKLDAIAVPEMPRDLEVKTDALRKQIADAERADKVSAVYAKVSAFMTPPKGPFYEGTLADLSAELAQTQVSDQALRDSLTTLKSDLKLLAAKLTHGTCTFCGKDFSGVPEVAARNADTTAKITATEEAIKATYVAVEESAEELAGLRSVDKAHRAVIQAAAVGGDDVELVGEELPQYLNWVGPKVGEVTDVASLKDQISALQASAVAYNTAVVRRDEAVQAVIASELAVEDCQRALDRCPEVLLDVAQTALDAARCATRAARAAADEARSTLDAHTRALADQKAAHERAVIELARVSGRLQTLQTQLVELEFNNALLKKVRACRPLLADKLWTLVLAASSSYFSDIRGVKSRVTKTSDGFMIDGHPVSSMSGSTLDALGLAIRVALVRTFLPSSPFLVLDEPSSAMDGDRTGNMLGFLSKAGFSQIILVTHEDVSETVADHIVTLGD